MAEAINAPWNPKKHYFRETAQRLVIEGFATYDENEDRYYVTNKGLKDARKLPSDQTSVEELAEMNTLTPKKIKGSPHRCKMVHALTTTRI